MLGYNLVEVPNMMSEVNDLTKLNRSLTDLVSDSQSELLVLIIRKRHGIASKNY